MTEQAYKEYIVDYFNDEKIEMLIDSIVKDFKPKNGKDEMILENFVSFIFDDNYGQTYLDEYCDGSFEFFLKVVKEIMSEFEDQIVNESIFIKRYIETIKEYLK